MGEASVITRKRCSLSRNARSDCFCAVISRATFEAPTTRPDESVTGEMVSETSIRLPSFRLRTVWKWSTRSPRRRRLRISDSSAWRSSGMIRVMFCPMASSAVYPNIRSALLFQLVITPSRFLLIMASSEEATMAANRPVISSARFGSFISGGDDLSAQKCYVPSVNRRGISCLLCFSSLRNNSLNAIDSRERSRIQQTL